MNINALTNEKYTAGNETKLNIAKIAEGFKSDKWLTFLQARKLHLKIKKGAKATLILIPAGHAKQTDAEGNEEETEKQIFKKCYLFNIDQTEKTNAEKRAEAEARQQPELPVIPAPAEAEGNAEAEAEATTEAPEAPAEQPAKTQKATTQAKQEAEAGDLIEQLKNKFKRAV